MNTKEFGNIGLAIAINYFVSHEYTVSVPLNDAQKYDLIIEDKGILKRVSVRSTRAISDGGVPKLHLRTTGGNQSFNYAKLFDPESCELIFAYAPNCGLWLIPTSECKCVNSMSLGKKYDQFKVELNN